MSFNTYPYSPFPASTEQLHKGDNEDLQAQIDAIKDGTTIDSFGDVETALATKTDNAVIAPEFDAEAGVYSVGDLVMYEGKLYEFTTAHETAGEWNAEEVSEKTVADEIDSLKSGLTNIETLQSISSDKLASGSITIKRNCGVKFVVCSTMTLNNDLAAGGTVELCAAGTVENPPSTITTFPVFAVSGGNDIAPVYLVIRPDGSICVTNFTSVGTKLYGYCCGAYI